MILKLASENRVPEILYYINDWPVRRIAVVAWTIAVSKGILRKAGLYITRYEVDRVGADLAAGQIIDATDIISLLNKYKSYYDMIIAVPDNLSLEEVTSLIKAT